MARGRPGAPGLQQFMDPLDGAEWGEFVPSETMHMGRAGLATKDDFVEAIHSGYYDTLDPREEKLKRLRGVIAERKVAGQPVDAYLEVVRNLRDAIPLSDFEAGLIPEPEDPQAVRERLLERVDDGLGRVREQVDSVEGLGERIDGFEGLLGGSDLALDCGDAVGMISRKKFEDAMLQADQGAEKVGVVIVPAEERSSP